MPTFKSKSPVPADHASDCDTKHAPCKMDVKSQSPVKLGRPPAVRPASPAFRVLSFSPSAAAVPGAVVVPKCHQCLSELVSPFSATPCRRVVCGNCVRAMKESSAACASCNIGCKYHAFTAQTDHAKVIARSRSVSSADADGYMTQFVTDAETLQSSHTDVMHSHLVRGILSVLVAYCITMRVQCPTASSVNINKAGEFAAFAIGTPRVMSAVVDYMKRIHGCDVVTTT